MDHHNNLDPELKQLFDNRKKELEALQKEKENAINEFIEEQTEHKIV